ncbi:hypothetical protein QC334_03080 [Streptomyces sp. DH18]|uniref:hypothetical protein n=1 Tax=unclassified Streptomyces TaxID=2593676 RepID=UPI001E50B653|nr:MULTISPECIES: hypothetical protein [unclassified Streptomyces]MDG9681732.1 hypothetical protein [Streptomyces sp. DH18]
MARFEHTVTVGALDRGWFEEAAGALVDLLDASRERDGAILLADGRAVDGIRLLKGRHLRPGARYGSTPEGAGTDSTSEAVPVSGATVLREWRPSRSIEVENVLEDASLSVRTKIRLREPLVPGALEVSLSGHNPKGGSLYRFSGRGRADPAAWWAAVDRPIPAPPAARPPVSGRAVHRLGKARLTITPRPAEDGSWQVSVVLVVRGRWLLRPVGAVALFFARGPVTRGFREAVDRAAEEWNTALAELTPLYGEALRREIAEALTEPAELSEPGEPTGPTEPRAL